MAKPTTAAVLPTLSDDDPESRRPLLERLILQNHKDTFDAGAESRYGKDKPRAEGRVLLEVQPSAYCPMLFALPNGWRIVGPQKGPSGPPAPKSYVEVYASDLPNVLKHVADEDEPQRIREAQEDYERAFAAEVRPHLEATEFPGWESMKLRDVVAVLKRDDLITPELAAAIKEERAQTATSFSASFYKLHERSPAPLASVTVLDANVSPPKSPDEMRHAAQAFDTAPALGAAIAGAIAQALAPLVAKIEALTEARK